ncbi:uncharacterized protein [Periplaneta americana]|uniref:uncharacterized protein isoform X2 n=1 Tax=Periplaneta americana TaxID=6978 RepID=UPI0037E80254
MKAKVSKTILLHILTTNDCIFKKMKLFLLHQWLLPAFLLLTNFLKVSFSIKKSLPTCPSYCKCFITLGMRSASCVGQRLSSIDTGVPHKVQILDLSNNSISSLELEGFKVLDLSSCQLDHFENDAFSKLPALLSLYLKNNQLIRLEVSVLKPLEKLQKIDLVGNPWPCDGKTDELEVWLNNNNKIKHDPICEKNKKTDKFERIISLVDKENATNIMSDEELLRLWSLSEKDKDSDLKQSESDCDKNISVSTEHNIIIKFFDKIPSFWSFMIGLEIGIVVGGIIMFIIHKLYEVKEPESPRSLIHSRGRSLLSLQNRTSFIRFRSDGDESTVLWTELETINCPDTPPPAYRDCLD